MPLHGLLRVVDPDGAVLERKLEAHDVLSLEVRPAGGYAQTPPPPGFVQAWVDPTSGGLASMTCPSRILEYLPAGAAEVSPCPLHSHHVADTTMTAALEPGSADSNEIVAATRRSAAQSIVRAFGARRCEGVAVLQRSGLVADGAPSEDLSDRWILIASPAEQTEVLELDGPRGRLLRVVPAGATLQELP